MALTSASLFNTLGPAIEKTVNLGLSVDPAARKKIKPLTGCILEVSVSAPDITLFFEVADDRVKVKPDTASPTVTFAGSALAMLKLALAKDKNLLFKTREIQLTGDAVRSEQLLTFVRTLNVDWEALLAGIIGDVPAHFINTTLKNGYHWSLMTGSSFFKDVEEFVKYELNLLPTRSSANVQKQAIDSLRRATNKLETRVKRLVNQSQRA
jgi:ubiquinone biosynthesis protein UbiJ